MRGKGAGAVSILLFRVTGVRASIELAACEDGARDVEGSRGRESLDDDGGRVDASVPFASFSDCTSVEADRRASLPSRASPRRLGLLADTEAT